MLQFMLSSSLELCYTQGFVKIIPKVENREMLIPNARDRRKLIE